MKQKKKQIKVRTYWNKIIWSNLFLSYGLLFLILTITCWHRAFNNDENKFYANLGFGFFLLVIDCKTYFTPLWSKYGEMTQAMTSGINN